ncbi:MAG: thioredoxin domain-containing protein, partial [Akkermansiaceae bacterium]|nr:thioredoxin domain-containing protein [Akkermansiaceae bacterium]
MAVVVVVGALLYPTPKPEPKAVATQEEAKHDLEIIHFHLPQNPESEQIADSLNKIAKKYGEQILVTRVDINAEPERAKAEKVTKPPKVVMMAGTVRACRFQGVWTEAQIERKVEEILRGLKRVGKDWRPDVAGMENAPTKPGIPGQAAPPSPASTGAATPPAPPSGTPTAVPGMQRLGQKPAATP